VPHQPEDAEMAMKLKATTLLIALSACHSAPPPSPEPPKFRFATVADSVLMIGLRETQWGIEVWDQGRNRPLYSHDGDRHFIPASNTKLVVTTTAMGLLGPEWRYHTPVTITSGTSADTALHTLVIKGTGDPTMSARFFGGDFAVLDSMADSLVAKGVKRIGDVVIDASVFTPEHIHSAWEIDDLP
jgi:D-alanyl-D-alanine carboxypeptidase/D-alanyl-D-alanine-endopeptidase (penicillin-binding protein 4)